MSRSAVFVAASTRQRFLAYCREQGLDPHDTRHIRFERDLLGCRGGQLTILPGTDNWQFLATCARRQEIKVNVLS